MFLQVNKCLDVYYIVNYLEDIYVANEIEKPSSRSVFAGPKTRDGQIVTCVTRDCHLCCHIGVP